MKNQRKSEIKVGITVILGLILLIWVFGWAKNFSFDSNDRKLTLEFDNVAGLNVGDPVSVKGIKKGYVGDIYIAENNALVEIVIDKGIDIKKDATFSLMLIDLMGGKKVEINPGTELESINFKKVQKGYFLGDISTTMAMLGSVQDDLVEVIKEVKSALNSMNKVLGDGEFTEEMKKSFTSLNILISKTDKLLTDNSLSIHTLLENSNELVSNSNKFITESGIEIQSSIHNINSLMVNTDSLVQQISLFMNDIENSNNNLGKIVNDEQILNDLKITMTQLKELSQLVLEQLKGNGFKVDADIF